MGKQKVSINEIPSLDERRRLSKKKFHPKDLRNISPKTTMQEQTFYHYNLKTTVMGLFGSAGCGKTFITLYLALRDVFDPNTPYRQIKLIRSAVPTRDVGFTPGSLEEKMAIYETPYIELCDQLFSYNSGNYQNLKELGYVEFHSTSYLRGTTFDYSIVIVDECQSMTFHELDTIMTRIGVHSRVVFCGDSKQDDLIKKKNDISGLEDFVKILKNMKDVCIIDFTIDDCVRSGIVYDYLKQKETQHILRTIT